MVNSKKGQKEISKNSNEIRILNKNLRKKEINEDQLTLDVLAEREILA